MALVRARARLIGRFHLATHPGAFSAMPTLQHYYPRSLWWLWFEISILSQAHVKALAKARATKGES